MIQTIFMIILLIAVVLLFVPGYGVSSLINAVISMIEGIINGFINIIEFIVNMPLYLVNYILNLMNQVPILGDIMPDSVPTITIQRVYLGRVYLYYDPPIVVAIKAIMSDPLTAAVVLAGVVLGTLFILYIYRKLPLPL